MFKTSLPHCYLPLSHIAISDESMSLISTTRDANDLHERVQVSRPSRIVGLHSTATEPTNQRHCQCNTPPHHPVSAAWSDTVNHADTKRYVKGTISLAGCGTCHNQNAGPFRAFERLWTCHTTRGRGFLVMCGHLTSAQLTFPFVYSFIWFNGLLYDVT